MTARRARHAPRALAELRARLAEAEDTLRAIRSGEVDAMVVAGEGGPRVFTLAGAEHNYRVLIESMNEGALTLTSGAVVLYANERFAGMVRSPLQKVIGGSFRRFLSAADAATLRALLRRTVRSGAKVQVELRACDGSRMPVQISIRPLLKLASDAATVGMVVTDMTEARRNEGVLRALFRRLAHAQEAERGRVALELHDRITQLLCAVLIRSQALEASLAALDGPATQEAARLRVLLVRTAEEVERIARGLRPSVLDQLGLVPVLRSTSAEFTDRTGVPVDLACAELRPRLPAETELALYRILQEALRNVERHADAGHVTVRVAKRKRFVHLSVSDDGAGFDPDVRSSRRRRKPRLGLISMGERAAHVDGELTVSSAPGRGTTIAVRVPFRGGVPGTR